MLTGTIEFLMKALKRMKPVRYILLTALVVMLAGTVDVAPVFGKQQFVAVVITGDLPRYREAHEAFVKILRTAGMSEEKLKVYVQTPNPDLMSWTNSVRKAVGVGADLIVTFGAPVTVVAKKEAKGIPVLFADVYDPVALGIVKDLAVTGGDISGVSSSTPIETLVKTFTDIHPSKRIGVLYTSQEQGTVLQIKRLEELGGKFGFSVVKADVKSADAAKNQISTMGAIDGLYLTESVSLAGSLKEIVAIATQSGIPVFSQVPGVSDLGALVSLEADPVEQGQLLGVHAVQVLNGQKVFTLPVRTPKKVGLIINMQAAEKMNIKVPFQALGMATRVIK